ncbi:MAG: nucleotide exchange factor GrpE [Bacillota bacterium]
MVEQAKNKREQPNGEAADTPLETENIPGGAEALPGGGEAAEAEAMPPEERIRHLEAALSEAEKKTEEYYQQLLRLRADFENFRRRINKEREEFLHFAGEALVTALLPVLDDFELALKSPGEHLTDFLAGVEMIYRRLTEILNREGLAVIPTEGEEFNPTCHEAVAFEARGENPPNAILEELRRGYTFRGKVVRPALVKVAKGNGSV